MVKLQAATSNPGKLREYRVLAAGNPIEIEPLPRFVELAAFDESAPTFAENSAGKAIHYSQFTDQLLIADDSGLVVPSLGGAPGVHSARYAGPNASDADRVRKLLAEMREKSGDERRARFVCVLTLAQEGRALAIFSDSVEGVIAAEPRGDGGFGYDPVFFFPKLGRTYAEISREGKNEYSHRGRAFRKLLRYLLSSDSRDFM
ncbi:MAG: RdgB/HAM1 family non-canonical purine NTP pyrophosphatase [Candidatus Acidiferrales bacterium]